MFAKRIVLVAGVAAMQALTSTAATRVAEQAESEESIEQCCFNNPAFSGTCTVQPAEDETCSSILAYLNNPMAEGKNYCGGTEIRQGWTEVECEADASVSAVPGQSLRSALVEKGRRAGIPPGASATSNRVSAPLIEVVQRREKMSFAVETVRACPRRRKGLGKDFVGDLAAGLGVAGAVHLSG